MALLLLIAGALAADCDLDGALEQAQETVLLLDFDAAQSQLDAVESSFGACVASSEQVARFWLTSAAKSAFQGDADARDEALIAAKAAQVGFWDAVWGEDLQAAWEDATAEGAPASLRLTGIPKGYVARVDGSVYPNAEEIAVDPGLHVVQVFAKSQGFGRVVRAQSGADVSVEAPLTELPPAEWADEAIVIEPAPVPRPTPEPKKPPRSPGESPVFALALGVGFGVWAGPGFSLDGVTEPGAKFLPAVEAGVWIAPLSGVWTRIALGADVALGSRFVYVAGEVGSAEGRSLPLAPVLHASGGVQLGEGPFALGGLVGLQLPSRVPVRLVGRWAPNRFGVEARVGANLLGERSEEAGVQTGRVRLEPAMTVLATFSM